MIELAEPLRVLCRNTVKMLAVDGVERANSGHPGMPMGCADLALEIWLRHLRYDPKDPNWLDRDRFVLSAGHGSMLLYSLLHLSGYDLSLDELKRFRQLGSKTPGHPEYGHAPGVETTTGPLGQGLANAVGMAIGAKMMQARFEGLVSQRVFGICGDGDLMEGISHEAASLAGHLGLDNLVFVYDDNHISIDGETELALSDDAVKRFESYGWFVQRIDGHNPTEIRTALDQAVAEANRPSLIVARTHIGQGAPNKVDSEKAHGSPLGKAEMAATRAAIGWPEEPFYIPEEVRAVFAQRAEQLQSDKSSFEGRLAQLPAADRVRLDGLLSRQIPEDLVEKLFAQAKLLQGGGKATRATAGLFEQTVAAACPWLVGGSADLNPSCNTWIEGSKAIERGNFAGRNIHFGVREHAMGAICNGLSLFGGFSTFGSTFLIFSDYMRPAIRLSALMQQQVVYVFTHDSVFLGEDGPTHQPIEQIAALRLIPGLRVVRPYDEAECAAAWAFAAQRKNGPTAIVLSRQKIASFAREVDPTSVLNGAYRLVDPANAKLVIIATGAEVALAVQVARLFETAGTAVRVVSAPCLEVLEDLGEETYQKVLPDDGLPRISIEAGRTVNWRGLVGRKGLAIGIDSFGASAPDHDLAEHFGLTPAKVFARIQAHLAK